MKCKQTHVAINFELDFAAKRSSENVLNTNVLMGSAKSLVVDTKYSNLLNDFRLVSCYTSKPYCKNITSVPRRVEPKDQLDCGRIAQTEA